MNQRNIIVYISGAYSAGNVAENIRTARQQAVEVWQAGYTALTPHLNTANFEQDTALSYEDFMEGDLALLSRCDCVLFLKGWEQSKGARIEFAYAYRQNKLIFYSLDELKKFYSTLELIN